MYQQQGGYVEDYQQGYVHNQRYYEQQYVQPYQQNASFGQSYALDPNAAAYYPAPTYYDQNYNGYNNGYMGRGRGRGRGGRGRGRGRGHSNFQYEYDQYNSVQGATAGVTAPQAQTESSEVVENGDTKSTRPKQRSYQGNRYRENRPKRPKQQGSQEERKDWRDNVRLDQAEPLNVEYPESKDDPNFSEVAQNSSEGSLPVKEKSRGYSNMRKKEKVSKENSKAVADMVVNKLNVTSEPTTLTKEPKETMRERKERLEQRDAQNRESPREKDEKKEREYRERDRGHIMRGRGGKGRFVKGKKRDDQDQRGENFLPYR